MAVKTETFVGQNIIRIMSILLLIILATLIDGFVALVGAFSFFMNEKVLRKMLMLLMTVMGLGINKPPTVFYYGQM